jgi:hypothetical protein
MAQTDGDGGQAFSLVLTQHQPCEVSQHILDQIFPPNNSTNSHLYNTASLYMYMLLENN